jgi:hypothetical protein
MKLKDKLIVKHKDTYVDEFIYIASTGTQHLFTRESKIVNSLESCSSTEGAILYVGSIAVTWFVPINKKHNFVQTGLNTWELDIEPIDKDDLI